MKISVKLLLAAGAALSLAACSTTREGASAPQIEQVATFDGAMPTGVTVAPNGRIFVNFPQWGDNAPFTVAELVDGKAVPYPDAATNQPDPADPGRGGPVDVVETPEAQSRAGRGERAHPLRGAVHRHVAFPAGAELLPGTLGGGAPGLRARGGELVVEQGVQPAEVPGLAGQLRLVGGSGGRRGLAIRVILRVLVHVLVF